MKSSAGYLMLEILVVVVLLSSQATGQRQMRYRSGSYELDTPLRRLRYRMAAPHPEEEPEMAKPPHPRAVPKLNGEHSSKPKLGMIKIAPVSKAEKNRAGLKFRQLETQQNYATGQRQMRYRSGRRHALDTPLRRLRYRMAAPHPEEEPEFAKPPHLRAAPLQNGEHSNKPKRGVIKIPPVSMAEKKRAALKFRQLNTPQNYGTQECQLPAATTSSTIWCWYSVYPTYKRLYYCQAVCGPGYVSSSLMEMKCNSGQWSPYSQFPECQAQGLKLEAGTGSCGLRFDATARVQDCKESGNGLVTCYILCGGEPDEDVDADFYINEDVVTQHVCNNGIWSPRLPRCATSIGGNFTTGSCGVRFDATATEKNCKDSGNGLATCYILCGGGPGNVDEDVVMQYDCNNGVWSPALPRCATAEEVPSINGCQRPQFTSDASVKKCQSKNESYTCSILCGKGYPGPDVPKEYVCNNGKWSKPLPSCALSGGPKTDESEDCQLQQVGDLKQPLVCKKDKAKDLNTCEILCGDSFSWNDTPRTFVCSHGNSWSPSLPSCVISKGGPQPSTDCQWVGTGGMKFGICQRGERPLQCKFQCSKDAVPKSYVCDYGSNWTPALPSCITPKAGRGTGSGGCDVQKKTASEFKCRKSGASKTCLISCSDDYAISYECSYGNNWKPPLPRCVTAGGQPTKGHDQCDLEGVQGFKRATCGGHLLSGTTCEIECSSPPSQRSYTCKSGTRWSPKLPPCVIPKVRLSGPGCTLQGLQGFVNGSCNNNYQETTCFIRCEGQTSTDERPSKCSAEQRTWTPALPECVMPYVMLTNWNGDCALQAVSALNPASKCRKSGNATTCNIQCDFGSAMTKYVCYYQNIWKPRLPSCVMPKAEEIP